MSNKARTNLKQESSMSLSQKKATQQHSSLSFSSSAILPDGRLNVSLLEKEIANDVATDARYKAEDEMKKRAIHMSKDYDEFRNFVHCSQLQPLHRSDVAQLFNSSLSSGGSSTTTTVPRNKSFQNQQSSSSSGQTQASWKRTTNRIASDSTSPSKKNNDKNSKRPPRNAMEFEREWKRRTNGNLDKLCYLTSIAAKTPPTKPQGNENSSGGSRANARFFIEPETIHDTIFKVELDAFILGDIIEVLYQLVQHAEMGDKNEEDDNHASNGKIQSDDGWMGIRSNIQAGVAVDVGPKQYDGDDNVGEGGFSLASALFVYRWLDSITKCGRFNLNVSFLSTRQREAVLHMCDFIEERLRILRPLCEKEEQHHEEAQSGYELPREKEGKVSDVRLKSLYEVNRIRKLYLK